MGKLGSLNVTLKLSEDTILKWKKIYNLAKKCQPRPKDYWSPWRIGVYCMLKELVANNNGFYSTRLAEQMYLASRVFEHNLAVRARQHGMRVR